MLKIAETMHWQPTAELIRLEGFTEDWERLIFKGREIKPFQTLQGAGLLDGDALAAVRKVLVAQGWKILDDADTSDDESE